MTSSGGRLSVLEQGVCRDYMEMRLMLTRIMLRGGPQGRMAKDVLDRTADVQVQTGHRNSGGHQEEHFGAR